jgi:hypothetical protein
LSGFAKAATVTQISPLNAKNWSTADQTEQIIPTIMKSVMKGADFTSTVDKANTPAAERAQHRVVELSTADG